jgi:Protein of unknown function (DUF3142)
MSCAIIGRVTTLVMLWVLSASSASAENVDVKNYNAFWLWAGVKPPSVLNRAQEIYLLAGEVSNDTRPHIISQRSAKPKIKGPQVWIVYRAQTLSWNEPIIRDVLAHIEAWEKADNAVVGLQIDFDAGTKHLDRYAAFLGSIRQRLPQRYRLSITGLLDWSANGDPARLSNLAHVVDEVVLQIYQGRQVIPGYQSYLAKLDQLHLPFKIGLLQGGEWRAPVELEQNEFFKGYVVFLVNK